MTRFAPLAVAAAISFTALAGGASAQQTMDIAPPTNPGNPGFPPPPSQCLAFTLNGATFVRVCNGGYSAQLGNTSCGGSVYGNASYYTFNRGQCSDVQNFLGGSLSCNGAVCNWTPSPEGFARGFRPQQVFAQYQ